jgi:Flp pilus assembly pilin Flp
MKLNKFKTNLSKLKRKGQSLAEYGLILGLVSVVAIVSLQAMGGQVTRILGQINNTLNGVNPAPAP